MQNGWRALHKAVADDALDYMKDLLDNGADIDARDEVCSKFEIADV